MLLYMDYTVKLTLPIYFNYTHKFNIFIGIKEILNIKY